MMEHQEAVQTGAAERYFLGQMEEAQRDEFEAHLFDCGSCAEGIRTLAALRANIQAELAHPLPALEEERGSIWDRWFGFLRPALAAPVLAGLLITISYQNFLQIPKMREQAMPGAADAVLLRGASRGAAAEVGAKRAAVLTLDMAGVERMAEYQVRILDSSGVAAREFRAAAPAEGDPLTVLVPAGSFGAGAYSIVLADPKKNTELIRFQFVIH